MPLLYKQRGANYNISIHKPEETSMIDIAAMPTYAEVFGDC